MHGSSFPVWKSVLEQWVGPGLVASGEARPRSAGSGARAELSTVNATVCFYWKPLMGSDLERYG